MKLSTARPLIGCTPSRYTCEQSFALRAWSYAWLRKAPLAEQVEALRHYPGLEPVYTAFAAKALRTNCPLKLQESAKELWRVTDRRSQHRPVVHRAAPHIAKHILA